VRGPIEFVLKLAVNRDRPDFSQLVHGAGYSFPSGHPMAAAVFWGSMPIVLALYWRRRSVWIVSWVVALSMIVLIGYSRVYLGVHWPTDVLAGLLAGILLISGLDWLIQRAGVIPGCSRLHGLGSARQEPDPAPAP
jgi:undecaprenyl-diphosphatase